MNDSSTSPHTIVRIGISIIGWTAVSKTGMFHFNHFVDQTHYRKEVFGPHMIQVKSQENRQKSRRCHGSLTYMPAHLLVTGGIL